MSIQAIPSSSRFAALSVEVPAVAPVARTTDVAAAPAEALVHQPTPRFPWLSRLSQQLESAAGQRAAFPPVPPLGDNLNSSA
jgi:hypothetical protein